MNDSGLSAAGLRRMHEVLARHVDAGEIPGMVAVVARHGQVHTEVLGSAVAGGAPMRPDSIFRIASVTKQIAAAAAMTLVEDCRLRLDDPVDDLLPELAGRRVLTGPGAALDDTVPAHRPITLRDLLTFRMGMGAVMAPPGTYPIQRAIGEAGVGPISWDGLRSAPTAGSPTRLWRRP
jgi:CubicO group peptidase (beta-lactamase class C family)